MVFNPSSETFNDTKLTLTNLEPVTAYTVQIHSQHGVSYLINPDGAGVGAGGYDNSSSSGFNNHYHHVTEPPNLGRSSDLDDIKTEYAEISFTTESAILSTVFNVK